MVAAGNNVGTVVPVLAAVGLYGGIGALPHVELRHER
jgi:hypothetical protein